MRILFWIFAAGLRIAEASERLWAWWQEFEDGPAPPPAHPTFWGWCVNEDKPGLIDRHWRCERCGSASVINVRAGGDETVRA